MTIIEKNKNNFSWVFAVLGIFIVLNLGWSIVNYNKIVNFRHDIASVGKSVREAEVQNAELKASLLAITSEENMKKTAAERGLVLENNPEYLKYKKLAER